VLLGWGSAGSVLRSQGSSGEDGAFALRAGDGLIASYARSGPIPLPLGAMECRCFEKKGSSIVGAFVNLEDSSVGSWLGFIFPIVVLKLGRGADSDLS
jgi:hypothetical protein